MKSPGLISRLIAAIARALDPFGSKAEPVEEVKREAPRPHARDRGEDPCPKSRSGQHRAGEFHPIFFHAARCKHCRRWFHL